MYKVEAHKKYKHYEYCVAAMDSGHRCGYVKTEDFDFAYKKKYDDLHDFITCHGGLTYGSYTTFSKSHGYWIGFDCAHSGDAPDPKFKNEDNEMYYRLFNSGGTVRTKSFCIDECKSIIDDMIIANKALNGGMRIGSKSML